MDNNSCMCENSSRNLNNNFYFLQREKSVWNTEVLWGFYLVMFLSKILFKLLQLALVKSTDVLNSWATVELDDPEVFPRS